MSAIFSFVRRGIRANSAAIQPRLRTILRVTSLRCASVQPGKASRRLNSAVFRNFGCKKKSKLVTEAAKLRATPRGSAPSVFKISQTGAYSSHSFIGCQNDRERPTRDSMQEVPASKIEFQC